MKTTNRTKKIVTAIIVLLFFGIGVAFLNKKEKVYVQPIQTDLPSQNSSMVIRGNEIFETLTPEAVPKDVVNMVKKFYPEAQITEVMRKTDIPDGDSEYNLKIDYKGKPIRAQIDVEPQNNNRIDGEINQTVSTNEIPSEVIQTFTKYTPNLAMQEAERRVEFVNDDWRITYRWNFKDPDTRIIVTEKAANQENLPSIEIRTRLNVAAIPQNLIETVNRVYNNPQIDNTVEKRFENNLSFYRFRIRTADGKKHDIDLSESGQIIRSK
ncbi:MAG: hypothetical protein N2487_04055 [Verrucomicrobiae bacterium]|nr:hypothetical protein [Verrucomicrobiae bacterium]